MENKINKIYLFYFVCVCVLFVEKKEKLNKSYLFSFCCWLQSLMVPLLIALRFACSVVRFVSFLFLIFKRSGFLFNVQT